MRPLRGGKGSVRHELARLYAMQYGKAPSAGVLADMILTIEAWCYEGPVREVHLRAARDTRAAWLDLGGDKDELAKIIPGEWGVMPSDGDGPLCISGLKKEAVVLTDAEGNDSIAIRSMQHFTLGFDHRLIDGADACKFMLELKRALETWNQEIA